MYFFPVNRIDYGVFSLPAYILAHGTQSVGIICSASARRRNCPMCYWTSIEGGLRYVVAVLSCLLVLTSIFFFVSKGVCEGTPNSYRGIFPLTLVAFHSAIAAIGNKSSRIYVGTGTRYFFKPNVIFLLLISVLGSTSRFVWGGAVATAMLVLAITVGVTDYRRTVTREPNWPQWKAEVRAWRENPQHRIAVWPSPGWSMTLRR